MLRIRPGARSGMGYHNGINLERTWSTDSYHMGCSGVLQVVCFRDSLCLKRPV